MNVNCLCGSGAQAIVSVIQSLAMGDAEFGLAGGAENEPVSFHSAGRAWGQKMGYTGASDMMLGAQLPIRDRTHGSQPRTSPPNTTFPAMLRTPLRLKARHGRRAISRGALPSRSFPSR